MPSAVQHVLTAHGATVRSATEEAERERLWKGRKSAFPAMGRLAPDYYCMDGTIPRAELSRVLARIGRAGRRTRPASRQRLPRWRRQLASADPLRRHAPAKRTEPINSAARILSLCVQAGGTITGEHGVGVEKLDTMCEQFSAAEIEQFHRLKAVFDAAGV